MINIPDTVTTKENGDWNLWLFTARTGEILKRRQIDQNSLTRRFLFEDDESKITDDKTPCAIARFRGGRTRVLNRKDFRSLIKHRKDRECMEALQMLMSSSKRTASYRNEYRVADDTGRVIRNTQKTLHSIQTYRGLSSTTGGRDNAVRCVNKRLCAQFNELTNELVKSIERGTRCRVLHFVSEFTVDDEERIWFLWCENMLYTRDQHTSPRRVENMGATSPARMLRDRFEEKKEDDVFDQKAEDVDTFVKQLTTARNLIQYDDKKKHISSDKIRDENLRIVSSSSSLKGDHHKKMPTPFACKGDFCNFAVHEPKVLTATEMYDQRARFARKLLSNEEFRNFEQQSAYLSREATGSSFEDVRRNHHYHDKSLCKITFRSIQLAREERRTQNETSSSSSSSSLPGYMKSTETRSRKATQNMSSQLSRAYEDVYVCQTCREVYKILDEARRLSEQQNETYKHSKSKRLLKDTMKLLRKKSTKRKKSSKEEEEDMFGDLDDYLRGGGKLRKSLYNDGLRSSDGFGEMNRSKSRKKSSVGFLPSFGRKKKSMVSPLGVMSATYRHNRNREFLSDDDDKSSELFSSNLEGIYDSKSSEEEKRKKKQALEKEKEENELSRIMGRTRKTKSPNRKERYIASILLGEASRIIREKTKDLLKEKEYDVTCTDNGQSVIEISKSKDFDLILIARDLPTIDGLATTKIFRQREARRKRKRRTPVIVFTNMLTQDDLRLYQDIGMDGCIPKPVERNSLLNTIEQAIPKHNPGPPLSPRTKIQMKKPGIDHSTITITSRHAKTLVDLQNANEETSKFESSNMNTKTKKNLKVMSTFEKTRQRNRERKISENKDIETGTYAHNPDTELAYSVLKFGDCPKDVPLFHFVVIHDFFDSMETMRIFFKPLVRKFQGLRVLVFNLPGQAYTKWNRKQLLNNKFYAEVLRGLLQHVDGTFLEGVY